MNNQLRIGAIVVFLIAFFAPLWSVSIALIGVDKDTAQYGGLQSGIMGVYNLALIIPSLVFLILGRKKSTFYIISIALSACSILGMCIWAFGGAS